MNATNCGLLISKGTLMESSVRSEGYLAVCSIAAVFFGRMWLLSCFKRNVELLLKFKENSKH